MDGWMDGWTDGRMDGWTDGRMAGWLDGWMAGWLDGWMDGWMVLHCRTARALLTTRSYTRSVMVEVAVASGGDAVAVMPDDAGAVDCRCCPCCC